MMNKPRKRINCQHCGRLLPRGNNLTRHETACAKRPSDDVLLDMYNNQALPLAGIAERLDVGYKTVRAWLQEMGVYTIVPRGQRPERQRQRQGMSKLSAASRLELRKDLAHPLAFELHPRCGRAFLGATVSCRGYDVCVEHIASGLPVLCEVPDAEQVGHLERRGVDLKEIVARAPA